MKKRVFGGVLVLFCATITAVFYLSSMLMFDSSKTSDTIPLKGTWDVRYGDEKKECTLPIRIENNDLHTIIFQKTLTKSELGQNDALLFYTDWAEVNVFADEELIYQYLTVKTGTSINSHPLSAYHIVKLPNIEDSTNLSIEINPYVANANELQQVYYGTEKALTYRVVKKTTPRFWFCITLFMFALQSMFYGITSKYLTKEEHTRRREFAILLLSVDIWCILDSPIRQVLFFNHYWSTSFILEVAFFSIPIWLVRYLRTFEEIRKNKIERVSFSLAYIQFYASQIMLISGVSLFKIELLMPISVAFSLASIFVGFKKRKDDSNQYKFFLLIGLGYVFEIGSAFFFGNNSGGAVAMIVCLILVAILLGYSHKQSVEKYINAEKEKKQAELSLEKARNDLLVSQIRPHFIFNTLTSIQTIIKLDPDRAYDLMYDFSRYLRSSINSMTNRGLISFEEEMNNIEAYLNIERIRLSDKLTVNYNITTGYFGIVPLSIQPLVENSIKHNRGSDNICIDITTREDDKNYYISVNDNGYGFDMKKLDEENKSVGLKNVIYRLETQINAKVCIKSEEGKGTEVLIIIPK